MERPDDHGAWGTFYLTGPGVMATGDLSGDDSRVIMDRVIPFVRRAAATRRPFFAAVWFHAPHRPLVACEPYRALYAGKEYADYYGTITAMDEQIGRLRSELRSLGIENDTMLWFLSDNGPEIGDPGSAGPFRGGKNSLYEGGVRVPALLVWPRRFKDGVSRLSRTTS
jgi:arylsulfatase A-like enzyme